MEVKVTVILQQTKSTLDGGYYYVLFILGYTGYCYLKFSFWTHYSLFSV